MKRTALALLALLVTAVGLQATDTRTTTLGTASMFVRDNSDMYRLPAAIFDHPRLLAAELSTAPAAYAQKGSASLVFSNSRMTYGVAGADINHAIEGERTFQTYLDSINTHNNDSGIHFRRPVATINSKYHLFYGRRLGSLDLALHLARSAGAYTDKTTDTVIATRDWDIKSGSGIWDINLGAAAKPRDNIRAELGLSFRLHSFRAEENAGAVPALPPVSNKLESQGGTAMDGIARVFFGMSPNLDLVPLFRVTTGATGFKTTYSDTANHPEKGEMSDLLVVGAVGANYRPVEGILVAGGLHLGYYKMTVKDSFIVGDAHEVEAIYSTVAFPGLSAAVEAQLVRWLCLRVGASKVINGHTVKHKYIDLSSSEQTGTDAPYAFSFGLGFTFGKLAIDARVNDEQPFALGYFMSGVTAEPLTQVSAAYRF